MVIELQLLKKFNLNQDTEFYSIALRKLIHNLGQNSQTCIHQIHKYTFVSRGNQLVKTP